jgi:hypothetical protein
MSKTSELAPCLATAKLRSAPSLGHGFAAVDLGPHRETGEHDRHGRETGDPATLLASSVAFGAAEDVVGGDAQKPGHHLGKRELFSVALLARVGCQHLHRLIGDLALIIELAFER